MVRILQKIKQIDAFLLGTIGALFLTLAMILFFLSIEGK